MRRAILGMYLAFGGFVASGHAQEATKPPSSTDDRRFEVATLKQNKSGDQSGYIRPGPGGRVTITNMSGRALVSFAYDIPGYFLVGGPRWLAEEKFDLVVKMEGDSASGGNDSGQPNPVTFAMRKLLSERFKLKLHTESREFDAYALVFVKPGVTGPALKPSSTDCQALVAQVQRGQIPPGPPATVDGIMPCSTGGGIGRISLDGYPIARAARLFMNVAGRPVVDRTGLTGNWHFLLTFAQERPANSPANANLPATDPDAPDFFTAIQEQLGLKLESTKASFEVTVIDAAEHHTEG